MNSSPALYDSTNEVQQGVGAKLIAEVLANNGDKLSSRVKFLKYSFIHY